ncbi:M18 family aminopeptidase [Peptococcus simiae]|uniref:M18 family aminopeptidase n=1 Tax=Peptococcus simiae TaxID=1643805 RepID=UPI0039802C1F
MDYISCCEALFDFIDRTPTARHTVQAVAEDLAAAGFEEVTAGPLVQAPRGFTRAGGFLCAWRRGQAAGFRLVCSHSDAPALRLKDRADLGQDPVHRLNVAPYGGAIWSSWMDRPLRVAGEVYLAGEDPFKPDCRLVDSGRAVCTTANLCIHMNGDLRTGYTFKLQKDLQPIVSGKGEGGFVADLLPQWGLDPDQVLGYELDLLPAERGTFASPDKSLMSVPRLDNGAMVYASLQAFLAAGAGAQTQVLVIFDHEEVGSGSATGAAALRLRDILEDLHRAFDTPWRDALAASFMVSADQAHGNHPNYPEKMDPGNAPALNGGPVVKCAANQSYATDGVTAVVFENLCRQAGVPVQRFYLHSDLRGGATLGPILAQSLPMPVVDVGNALLAMHAPREVGGCQDQVWMQAALQAFYEG